MNPHPEYPLDSSATAEPKAIESSMEAYRRALDAQRATYSGLLRVETIPDPPMPNLVVTGGLNRAQRRARLK